MVGARFLEADFMRINLACATPTVEVKHLSCTVVKGGAAACTVIAMQDGGTGAGAQHGGAGRDANLTTRTSMWPPGRGDFLVSNFPTNSSISSCMALILDSTVGTESFSRISVWQTVECIIP